MRSNSSLLWTLGFEIAYRLEIKDRGTGQCPDCFTIVFEIFEMIFLPIHVSRWSWQMPARLLSNAERMSLRCSLSRRCSCWPSLMPNSSKRYSMTWSSDMLLLRSSSYSRHEMFSPRGVSSSSESSYCTMGSERVIHNNEGRVGCTLLPLLSGILKLVLKKFCTSSIDSIISV